MSSCRFQGNSSRRTKQYWEEEKRKRKTSGDRYRWGFLARRIGSRIELERVHSAHKAFLLALIRSGKINTENLLKVLAEVKQSGSAIDTECIYCKYSQFALKESNKVGLL